jgi:hypothetical protein
MLSTSCLLAIMQAVRMVLPPFVVALSLFLPLGMILPMHKYHMHPAHFTTVKVAVTVFMVLSVTHWVFGIVGSILWLWIEEDEQLV